VERNRTIAKAKVITQERNAVETGEMVKFIDDGTAREIGRIPETQSGQGRP